MSGFLLTRYSESMLPTEVTRAELARLLGVSRRNFPRLAERKIIVPSSRKGTYAELIVAQVTPAIAVDAARAVAIWADLIAFTAPAFGFPGATSMQNKKGAALQERLR